MKHILYTITLSVLITTLISGCGRKAAPKYVEGGFYPQIYPKPDKTSDSKTAKKISAPGETVSDAEKTDKGENPENERETKGDELRR